MNRSQTDALIRVCLMRTMCHCLCKCVCSVLMLSPQIGRSFNYKLCFCPRKLWLWSLWITWLAAVTWLSVRCLDMADRHEYESLLEDDEDDEDVSRHLSPLCDPTHLLHRILVLVFMCFLGFGSVFLTSHETSAIIQRHQYSDRV